MVANRTRSTTINLDHDSATIYTNSDGVLSLTRNGAVLIGDGTNVVASEVAGAIRYNRTLGQMEMSDGTEWKLLGKTISTGESIIYAIIFGG